MKGEATKAKETRDAVITARTSEDVRETLEKEGALRGHSLSEAIDQSVRLGLPIYVKKVERKFDPATQ